MLKRICRPFFWLKLESKSITIKREGLAFFWLEELIPNGSETKIYESVDP